MATKGYAFVNVTPDTDVNPAEKTVDVTYKVSKGPEVYIDKIDITGNTKTRDKVIRRELELGEQQRFSGSKLRRSQERLRRLGFFEDVNITTRKAESEDQLDLLVDVKEASTGAFSAGAGISSGESFLFNVRLSEINLFGRGQRLVLNADFGAIHRNFSLDFTEPYFLDTELTTGFSLFNWQLIFDEFTRGGTGASVRTLYPFSALGWDKLGPSTRCWTPGFGSGVPHRRRGDHRRQPDGGDRHSHGRRHQPDEQPHPAPVPRYPQSPVRSDRRLAAGPVLRVRRARRPEQIHQSGSARALVLPVLEEPDAGDVHRSRPAAPWATVWDTVAGASCRCSSATSPAASIPCAASVFCRWGRGTSVTDALRSTAYAAIRSAAASS